MQTARNLMTPHPATVRVDATIRDAAHLFETSTVRHLPVVDKEGTLVGMLSDRDLHGVVLPRFTQPEHASEFRDVFSASVATIMSGNVISVGEEATARHVVGVMLENKIGAVPVVNRRGALVGIVSYIDVLRQLPMYED